MNTREFVKIGEDEQNIVFNEIDKEDKLLFRNTWKLLDIFRKYSNCIK